MATICFVNGVFPPDINGGAENYVLRTAARLQDRGHEVAVLTTKPYGEKDDLGVKRGSYEGVPVYRFYPLNTSHRSEGTGGNVVTKALWHQLDTVNPHAKRVVRNTLDEIDPDVVHTNNFMGISAATGKAVERSDAEWVHMLHDYSLMCPKSNLMRERTLPGDQVGTCHDPPAPCKMYAKAKKYVVGTPDRIVGPSQHVIDVHREHEFFKGVPSDRIQHGVTDVAGSPPKMSDESALLYAGKHQRSKGLETLFAAAERLPDVTFHLCGSGPMAERSEEVAADLSNVQYHGFVSEERLGELRQEVGATVIPSIWMENSPLVVYESFAAGLPVIGSRIGGIPELVEAGVRGTLFEAESEDGLVESVSQYVGSTSEQKREMSENALDWANDHTMDHHVNRLLELYGVERVRQTR